MENFQDVKCYLLSSDILTVVSWAITWYDNPDDHSLNFKVCENHKPHVQVLVIQANIHKCKKLPSNVSTSSYYYMPNICLLNS